MVVAMTEISKAFGKMVDVFEDPNSTQAEKDAAGEKVLEEARKPSGDASPSPLFLGRRTIRDD